MREKPPLYLLLHNIRSVHNVGAIFRTAEAAGVAEIILFGYTPTPIDRFGRVRSDFHKAALGAETMVSWRQEGDIDAFFAYAHDTLKAKVVAVEQTEHAVPYTEYHAIQPTVLVMGNEREGVPLEVCALADAVVQIPMSGRKESLNVSVATGIVLFALRDTL